MLGTAIAIYQLGTEVAIYQLGFARSFSKKRQFTSWGFSIFRP